MRINNHLLKNYLLEKKLIKNSDSVDFKEVGRGAFNINYLVEASGGEKFLFRFIIWSMRDHIGDMVKYESLALRNLEGLDISPKLILTDGTKSAFRYPLIVEEYIDGKTIKQGQGKFIEQVIEALPVVIKLYQNGETEGIIPQSEIISSGLLERKLECFEKYDSFLVKIINLNKNIIIEFTEKCNKLLNDKVFVHGDLNPENFIYSEDKKWYLVDWQSSFVGDASFDIATLLWDFYWNFFIGKPLDAEQKELIKNRYCDLSNTDRVKLKNKIDITTIFLDFDMLTRIEYLFLRLTHNSDLLGVEDEEKNFIIEKRVSSARALLVNEEILLGIITKMKKYTG